MTEHPHWTWWENVIHAAPQNVLQYDTDVHETGRTPVEQITCTEDQPHDGHGTVQVCLARGPP